MFELLFKYPSQVFSRGTFVLLGGWPMWLLGAAIAAAAACFGWMVLEPATRADARVRGAKRVAVWLMQTALASLLLLMLWHPALSVATLQPAAEHCRGGGGRFRQHGRRRFRQRVASRTRR